MRKLIKKILKENELQWINDVKSNQDIAQEIADETKIKNDLLHTPFSPRPYFSSLFPHPSYSPTFLRLFSFFTKYGKEQYGLDNEDDINDVWERYKKLIKYRVNNINESDEFDFIRNVVPEVAKGLLLCNGDAYFDIYRIEITKVEEDKVFFTDLDTGYRYLDPLDNIMKGLKDGKWTICNPLKESDDFDWIKDVKTSQDISQEIADKTEIKNGRLYTPFLPTFLPAFFLPSSFSLPLASSPLPFIEYCEEQYGSTKKESKYIWRRYKKIIKDKINNLNENDDMQWIRDVDVTVPFDEVGLQRYKLIINNREGFLTHLNDCGMHTLADSIDDVEYVTLVSSAQLESAQVFCGNDRKHSYTGWKHGLELKFHLNKETDSSHRWRFWVVDVGDISLAPF